MNAATPGEGVRAVAERVREAAPREALWIADQLERSGHEAWLVGGALRDVLLGHEGGDWDLATGARPGDVQRIFRRTVPLGLDYGTVGVLGRSGTLYEVTTFRRDVETFGRRAVVAYSDTIEEDLARRDFTINAIAWRPVRGTLLDPFGGLVDLREGVLRTVGVPADRFAEDYLRVLRALRFAGRFGFEIDPATRSALQGATPHLPSLSPERIREELVKVLALDATPSRALSLYRESGTLSVLFPELDPDGREGGEGRWAQGLRVTEQLPARRPLVRLAALLQSSHPPVDRSAAAILVRLRFSNADADRVGRLVSAGPTPPLLAVGGGEVARRWLARFGGELLSDAVRIWIANARASSDLSPPEASEGGELPAPALDLARSIRALRAEAQRDPVLSVAGLSVDGRDLMKLGLRPGPRVGKVLRALLERVLVDPESNRRETLLATARDLVEEGDR